MNNDRNAPAGASDEPARIQDSEAILAEEDLRETSTRTRVGVIPSGYGSIGGPIRAEQEGPDDGARGDVDDGPPDDDN
jgi:hypothetical protein